MRIAVIGATGHVGTYLVPRLVRAGHEVVALSRGQRSPYRPAAEWRSVRRIAVDREAEDPRPPGRPLVHCGTIWVHGPAARVPVTEDEPRTAYGGYGTGKAAIEALLHRETVTGGVPSVVLHPGHI